MADFREPKNPGPGVQQPKIVTVAGIIWIIFGSLLVLYLPMAVLATLVAAAQGRPTSMAGFTICLGAVIALLGAACIAAGVQTVRATARHLLAYGICSLILSVPNLYGVTNVLAESLVPIVVGSLHFLCGCGLLAAGVLVLIGRSRYEVGLRSRR